MTALRLDEDEPDDPGEAGDEAREDSAPPRTWRRTFHAQAPTFDPAKLRSENRRVLLNLVWSEREISRADLARATGLSRSTVSAIATELLACGLVNELGAGASSGGRRPIVLGFDDEAYGLVGVDMGASHVAVAVTNLRGAVRAWVSRAHAVREDPEGTLRLVKELVATAIKSSPWKADRVLGVGLAAPCPIVPPGKEAGGVYLSPAVMPAWRDVDVVARVRADVGRPVFLDNDANLGALAELWWGAGTEGGDLAYIKVGTGIGAGFVVHGALYRGANGVAGEIGHVVLDPEGPLCMCGLRGCLVTQIGAAALVSQVEQQLQAGHTSRLRRGAVDVQRLVDAALDADPVALEVVRRAGRQLGIAIANLMNLLNPDRVIIGGSLTRAGRALFDPLDEMVHRRTLFSARESTRVSASTLGETSVAVGAATQVLEAVLADESFFPVARAAS